MDDLTVASCFRNKARSLSLSLSLSAWKLFERIVSWQGTIKNYLSSLSRMNISFPPQGLYHEIFRINILVSTFVSFYFNYFLAPPGYLDFTGSNIFFHLASISILSFPIINAENITDTGGIHLIDKN